jgi:hypothetical protein
MPALEAAPPSTLRPFRGPRTTIDAMRRAVTGVRGERSVRVRSFTETVVRGLQPKDYLGEILAIRYAVAEFCRYTNDPISTEWVKDPERIVEEIEATGKALLDCDEIAMLISTMVRQVGREAEFVTVGFGAPNNFSHVFNRTKEPKSGKWIVCDPVAGTTEDRMLARVSTYQFWRID